MRNDRLRKIIILGVLVVAVVALSIGFASYSSTLKINQSLNVKPNDSAFSVIFSSDGINESDVQTVVGEKISYNSSHDFEVKDAKIINNGSDPTITGFRAVFTEENQYATYKFYVKNNGKYSAYLKKIIFGDKTCTAIRGTNEERVEQECKGGNTEIRFRIGNNIETYDSMDVDITDEPALLPSQYTPVEVTVMYNYDEGLGGDYIIEFGSITLQYSSQ